MSRLWRGAAAVLAAGLALRAEGQATPEVIVVPEAAPPGATVEAPATRPSDAATQPATMPAVDGGPATMPAEEVEPELPPPVREYALRAEQKGGAAAVYDGKRVVMEYRFADDGGEPQVAGLTTPQGRAVLGGEGGLSLSMAANNAPDQRQVHAGVVLLESAVRGGVEQMVHWKSSEGTLLVEENRSVQVIDVPELEVTLVQWTSKLRVPRGGAAVRLSGLAAKDGLRLMPGRAASVDVAYTFSDPAAKGEKLRTGAHLTPGEWCAMAVKGDDGRWMTVVMMAHPANPPPAVWYTRGALERAEVAGTLIGWREPVVVKAGDSVELAFGVAAFDGQVEGEAIGKVYKHWKRMAAPKPRPKLLEP